MLTCISCTYYDLLGKIRICVYVNVCSQAHTSREMEERIVSSERSQLGLRGLWLCWELSGPLCFEDPSREYVWLGEQCKLKSTLS